MTLWPRIKRSAAESIAHASLRLALLLRPPRVPLERLRAIVPDISRQESRVHEGFNAFWELKRRALQSFQCSLMLEALAERPQGRAAVVDIGDSAGTHMLYLRELLRGRHELESTSVNLDERAVAKIRARGLAAERCRAEDFKSDKPVDLFTSFEMLEHLHDPALFLRRLACRPGPERLVITVPYLRRSRVGLHHTRTGIVHDFFAEDEHVFELSPGDWALLMRHAGWRVVLEATLLQYPRGLPLLGGLLARFWRRFDYEGFWGAILEKDRSMSDCYKDWT